MTNIQVDLQNLPALAGVEIPEELAFLYKSNALGMFIVDRDLNCVGANRAWCLNLGFSQETLIQSSSDDLTHCDDREEDRRLSTQLFAGEISSFEMNRKWLRHDGSILLGRLYASSLFRDGAPHLRIAVVKLDTPLERSAQSLSESEMGQFACGIAHDLNNLLFVIQANLSTLNVDESQQRCLEIIDGAVERAGALSINLLSACRPMECEDRVAQVGEVLDRLELVVERLLPERTKLKTHLQDHEARVPLSEACLDRALMNLILNARDAMPEGGDIELDVRSNDHEVTIEVKDSGVGIPLEDRKKIFQPFFSTKPSSEGTGLGLAIVHSIVEKVDGQLGVQSEMGVGTTISMAVPRLASA